MFKQLVAVPSIALFKYDLLILVQYFTCMRSIYVYLKKKLTIQIYFKLLCQCCLNR